MKLGPMMDYRQAASVYMQGGSHQFPIQLLLLIINYQSKLLIRITHRKPCSPWRWGQGVGIMREAISIKITVIVKLQIMNKSRTKLNDNIEFQIYIGEYRIVLNTPKETRVCDVISMVASYENIHQQYGPSNNYFIGLASREGHEIIDYWLTQPHFNFVKFQNKLVLYALYSNEKKIDCFTTNQLEFLKCLGEGACGSVYLVRSRITGYLFALKRIKKQSVQQFQDMLSLRREQKILKTLDFNNHTVKFHASYESVQHFNFLLEFYPGGELFVHMAKQKLGEKDYKNYFCEVLAAIEFLHKNNILYRDLKPENIFVDINGHLHIGDFGLSKCNFAETDNANSHCGSPDYMAPEIIENKDYNFSSDFYSIGAILHQFVTGLPPYYEVGEGQIEEKLIRMKKMSLRLDEHTSNPHLKTLIKNLLHPNPDLRVTSFQEIKKSPWLADVDWKKIEQKTSTAPFAPNIYGTYIHQEFLNKQQEVNEMNNWHEVEKFQGIDMINYIRPESEKLLLGKSRTISKDSNIVMKRKPNMTKEKSSKNLHLKPANTPHQISKANNISIALYEKHTHREQRGDTASTSNSNVSCYEAKTSKHSDLKQNCNFRKEESKKNVLKKVPSCNKILTNPSSMSNSHNTSECSNRKKDQSKEKSTLVLKSRNTEMLKSRSNLTPAHKSKSKEKGSQQTQGFLKTKEQPYMSTKAKKEILPVSSYKIKLI